MPPHRLRFTIGQIMVAVAVLAVAMALVGPRFAPAFVATFLVPGVSFVAVRRRWGVARSRIAAWLLVAYPIALLAAHYTGWAVAWVMLGGRPGYRPGGPGTLGFPAIDLECIASLLLFMSFPASWLCIGFVLAEVVRATRTPAIAPDAVILFVTALASWGFLLLIVGTDPGRSFAWLFD